jgi:hypothetical protein
MAKIVGCEVAFMEGYDEFRTLYLPKIVECEIVGKYRIFILYFDINLD